jgi:hypothetical protein
MFQRVFAIVYLTEVTDDLAPTYVVPRPASEDVAFVTEAGLASYSREDHPERYDAERAASRCRPSPRYRRQDVLSILRSDGLRQVVPEPFER